MYSLDLRKTCLLGLAACVLPFALVSGQTPNLRKVTDVYGTGDTLLIVIVGSSTAEGYGATAYDSTWVGRYAHYAKTVDPRFSVVNLARGGYSTYHCLPSDFSPVTGRPVPDTLRNVTRALSLHPAAILLNLPSNDASNDYDSTEQRRNFQRIVSEAEKLGVPVWVSTSQPRNLTPRQRALLAEMRDWVTTSYGTRTLDFWNGLADTVGVILPEFDSGDGIHLNDLGHAALFERVKTAGIIEYLLQRPAQIDTTKSKDSVSTAPSPTLSSDNDTTQPVGVVNKLP